MKNQNSSASYSYHGSKAMHEQSPTTTQIPTVPRSIIKTGKHTINATNELTQQWLASLAVQQQTAKTNHAEERTVMSSLSPDDSAKTMMTKVSQMVETLGNVGNALAKESTATKEKLGSVVNTLAKESASTNDTIKQMMIQQTTTMNNFMMLMTRNEERRQEVPPIGIIQKTSKPTNSTITNSQYSLLQQSSCANKRKTDGIADDETIVASTIANESKQMEEDDKVDEMSEEQPGNIFGLQEELNAITDTTMTDKDHTTTNQQEQQGITTTNNRITTAITEGDFSHQFNTNRTSTDTKNNSTPTGVNHQ
jgi:hypothetical protein